MGPMLLTIVTLFGLCHFSVAKVCLGCSRDMDPKNPDATKFLEEKLHDLKDASPKGMDGEDHAELVRITDIRKKVVSGIQYTYEFEARGSTTKKLYNCEMVVVQQAWKGSEHITDFRCQTTTSRITRSLLGGEKILDVANDDKLEELKSFIGQEIGEKQSSKYLLEVVKFFKATRQVVEGYLIKATVEVAPTNCQINDKSIATNCKIQNQDHQVCEVEVWLKPSAEMNEMKSVNCRSHPTFCAGCPVKADPEDPTVQKCLKRTLSNINAQSESSKNLSLIKINQATSQVVAGVKYTLEFEAVDEISKTDYTCKAVIIVQPWISKDPVVADFHCDKQ